MDTRASPQTPRLQARPDQTNGAPVSTPSPVCHGSGSAPAANPDRPSGALRSITDKNGTAPTAQRGPWGKRSFPWPCRHAAMPRRRLADNGPGDAKHLGGIQTKHGLSSQSGVGRQAAGHGCFRKFSVWMANPYQLRTSFLCNRQTSTRCGLPWLRPGARSQAAVPCRQKLRSSSHRLSILRIGVPRVDVPIPCC